MRKCVPLVVLLVVLAGCASMTPEQKARLQYAQDFADEVTQAYNAPRVKVIVMDVNSYWPYSDWVSVVPAAFNGDVRVALVDGLAMATIPAMVARPCFVKPCEERRWRAEATQRGVEIMVKYLNMSTREAVEHYAASFVASSARRPVWHANMPKELVPPCDQLNDLWSHFEMASPKPTCPPEGSK